MFFLSFTHQPFHNQCRRPRAIVIVNRVFLPVDFYDSENGGESVCFQIRSVLVIDFLDIGFVVHADIIHCEWGAFHENIPLCLHVLAEMAAVREDVSEDGDVRFFAALCFSRFPPSFFLILPEFRPGHLLYNKQSFFYVAKYI
jgi:hypothetical protein